MKSILTIAGFLLIALAIYALSVGEIAGTISLLGGAIGCGVAFAIVDRLDRIHAALTAKPTPAEPPAATLGGYPVVDVEAAKTAMRAALKP